MSQTSLASLTQCYWYDGVNRLTGAQETNGAGTCPSSLQQQGSAWSRNFNYDQYGNMWVTNATGIGTTGQTPNFNIFTASNQMAGVSYDAAGNQVALNGLSPNSNVATYDAENRQAAIQQTQPSVATESYLYDGDGHRMEKVGPDGSAVIYVYDAMGDLAAEYSSFAVSAGPCTTCFLTADQLGSTRLVTDQSANLIAFHDYLPFGEEINNGVDGRTGPWGAGADTINQKFTGKERDSESGLDYFGARFYGSALGRFTSPDPLGGHYEDPQTLNKYAYVRNNPLTLTDPTGLDIWLKGCGKDRSTCQDNYVGTTDRDGNFQRTHLTGDQTKDATLGAHGITVTQDGKQYQGVWDTDKGENGKVLVAGEGALKGYNGEVNGNCGGTCVASGEIRSADPKAGNITQALFGVLNAKDSGYVKNAGTDAMNFFHPGATNFRGHTSGDPTGIPSTHIPIDPKVSLPNNEWHVDGAYPYDGVRDWLGHAGCAIHLACNPEK